MPKLIKSEPNSTTVTVSELIEYLSLYPPDTAIAYQWEGQVTPIVLDEIAIMQETAKVHGPVVLMNAET
jgi:hypothetical protein